MILFDLSVDPVLDASEISEVLKVLESVHVEEVVPDVVHVVDMRHEVFASALQRVLVGKTDVALTVPLMLYFLLGISLLCEFVDDDGRNNVAQQNFEESPVHQVWNELTVVVFFVLTAHALPNDLLRIERAHACDDRVAVLVNSIDINVDFFVLVERTNVVVQSDEPEDEREGQCKEADEG